MQPSKLNHFILWNLPAEEICLFYCTLWHLCIPLSLLELCLCSCTCELSCQFHLIWCATHWQEAEHPLPFLSPGLADVLAISLLRKGFGFLLSSNLAGLACDLLSWLWVLDMLLKVGDHHLFIQLCLAASFLFLYFLSCDYRISQYRGHQHIRSSISVDFSVKCILQIICRKSAH